MVINEVLAKSILSPSKIHPYVLNPYTGCQHACTYCYARFMQRYSGHTEPWGRFVDIKVNAAELLAREVLKKKVARVWVSGICDPYQPLEARYRLSRACLEILVNNQWPVSILTRSALVLRDLDILRNGIDLEAGFSVTTADDRIRRCFEPSAPPIAARLEALDQLHQAGIRTYAMIAPLLPGAEGLAEVLPGKVDRVILDKMNYHYADWVYRRYALQDKMGMYYYLRVKASLTVAFRQSGIECLG
jgi:DNA repair photolyase